MYQCAMLLWTYNSIMPGKEIMWICNETYCQDGWVTLHPWVREYYSISTGILLSCCKLDLLKGTIPVMEHTPLKERRKEGSWFGISCPVHLLMPDGAISSGQHGWCAWPGQVPKAASLPLLKAKWACSVFHWYDHLATIFVPSTGLEDIK